MSATALASVPLLAIPFAVIGLALMAAGAVLLAQGIRLQLRGRIVEAEVVRREPHRVPVALRRAPNPGSSGGGGGPTVSITFAYRTGAGEARTARLAHQVAQRSRGRGRRLNLPLGARVGVLIDPARPDIAFLAESACQRLVFPGLMLGAGLVATAIGLGIAFG